MKTQKLILQILVGILGIIPLYAGANEFLNGPVKIADGLPFSNSLDSEFRFMSAFWFSSGLLIYWLIPRILEQTTIFTLMGVVIFLGGCGRVMSILQVGWPDREMIIVMILELGIVPLIVLWQRYLAKKTAAAATSS